MITKVIDKKKMLSSQGKTGYLYVEIYGLSTDEKPTDVPNATPFLEMDTKKIFLFDEENKAWLEQ